MFGSLWVEPGVLVCKICDSAHRAIFIGLSPILVVCLFVCLNSFGDIASGAKDLLLALLRDNF